MLSISSGFPASPDEILLYCRHYAALGSGILFLVEGAVLALFVFRGSGPSRKTPVRNPAS
ncbi:MAG: hypothetical protein JWP91_2613 [Fibrobacteres bacterium]|nr:hypothetical protein [Fibrobacterota bacterium]